MREKDEKYIPALKFSFLTPLFDPLVKIAMREKEFRNALLEQADIRTGHKVLDFGCGTGTLLITTKIKHPDAIVVGIDVDEKVVKIAREKIVEKKLDIEVKLFDGKNIPYGEDSFERVMSSLVFHHLNMEQKENVLKEIFGVLKLDGEIHIADIGKPRNKMMKAMSYLLRLFEPIDDNIRGLIPVYLERSGFSNVKENRHFNTLLATLSLYSGKKFG